MNAESILKTDSLDILFENRNKEYGAYALRKFYPERIKRALMIMLLLVAVFCVYAIVPAKENGAIICTFYEDPTLAKIDAPKKQPEKKVEPITTQKVNTQKFPGKITIDNTKDSIPEIKTLEENIKISGVDFNDGTDVGLINVQEAPVSVSVEPKTTTIANPNEVVEHPDVVPEYPGGIEALRNFLQRNLQNPAEMNEGEIVAVKIKFIVGYDGTLKGFETVQDGGEEFNNEVIRVLKRMPHWIPGKSNGQNVSVFYTIPVKFVSND